MTEIARNLGYFFPKYRSCINFGKINGWATFWAIFSHTRQVTLQGTDETITVLHSIVVWYLHILAFLMFGM
jgi:hypothetical protein